MKERKRLPFSFEPSRKPGFSASKEGLEVQTWGLDADKSLVCAGVDFVPELSAKWIFKLLVHWRRWRKWYDNLPENIGRDYPAKHDKAVAFYGAHPCNAPRMIKWLERVPR